MGEHRAGQQGQFRQAPTTLRGVDELACTTEGLFGHQRHLFDRPTRLIQTPQGVPGQLERGDQHPRFLEACVMNFEFRLNE